MAPIILGMGNPLLDISADVTQETVDKYSIAMGEAGLTEDPKLPLFDELAAKKDVKYIAGGATQNSIRVAQWMLQDMPNATAYMGCVGEDDFAQKLRDACKSDGVDAHYMVDKTVATGKCAVTILAKERGLTTYLGAANSYKPEHLKEKEQWSILEGSKIVYSAGFFLTVSLDSILLAQEQMLKTGGIHCLNISAPFLCFVPPLKAMLDKAIVATEYLFCNETEARAYGDACGWNSKDVEFIATRLSLADCSGPRKRKVVITQGADPTVVAINGDCTLYPVPPVPADKIVDTNGAGDAFVGGFLAALSKNMDVKACCAAGNYSASVIIQTSGCDLSAAGKPTWKA